MLMHDEELIDISFPPEAALSEADGIDDEIEGITETMLDELDAEAFEETAESTGAVTDTTGELTEGVTVTFDSAKASSDMLGSAEEPGLERENLESTSPTPRTVLEMASDHYGLTLKTTWSSRRSAKITQARYSAYLALRGRFGISSEDIARLVGKQPTSVYNALRFARNALNNDPEFAQMHARFLEQLPTELPEFAVDELAPIDFEQPLPETEGQETVSPGEIMSVISQRFDVSVEKTWGIGRDSALTKARHLTYLILQDRFDLTREEVGLIVGKSPGAVKVATLKAREALNENPELERIHEQLLEGFSAVTLRNELPEIVTPLPSEGEVERMLAVLAHYFSIKREELTEYGDDYTRQAKRVAINLCERMNVHPGDVARLLGYKTTETIYSLRRHPTDQTIRFADDIWTAFRNDSDFPTGVMTRPDRPTRRRRTSRPRRIAQPEAPALPKSDVERLTLTAANYFGIEPVEIGNSNARRIDTVTARTIIFWTLENEFGVDRKHIAEHFGRTTKSISVTIKNGSDRLKENRRAISEIIKAFRAGETLEERAKEIKEQRIKEALDRRRQTQDAERKTRDVPEEERALFEGLKHNDPAARRQFTRLYGELPDRVLAAEVGSDLSPELHEAAEAALWKTARYFIPENHQSFEEWVTKVITHEVVEKREEEAWTNLARTVSPQQFAGIARSFREQYTRTDLRQVTGRHAQEAEAAKDSAKAYLDTNPSGLDKLTKKARKELEQRFLKEVVFWAKIPYVIRKGKTAKNPSLDPRLFERELPRFTDYTEEEQRGLLEVILDQTLQGNNQT